MMKLSRVLASGHLNVRPQSFCRPLKARIMGSVSLATPLVGRPLFVAGGLNRQRLLPILLLLLLAAAPLYAQQGDRYDNLPQIQSLQGFPDLGYPSALVDIRLYAAFDDPASAQFWTQTFDPLLPRIRSGEVRVIFVPLFGQSGTTGGRAAARASICANAQGLFWQYADKLFEWQTQFGADAFSGDRLLQGALDIGANRAQWGDCFTNDGPDVILNDAATAAANEPTFTTTPYVVVGDSPSLTDIDSLNFTIDLQLRQANAELAAQTAQATPEATSDVDRYTFDPLAHDPVHPPITISLPQGWSSAYDALVLQDIDGIRPVPFAIYSGPVTGGVGYIVLLWGFPNLTQVPPPGAAIQPDVWMDGTRLLRLAIVEEGCNVGTDLRRNYSVGGLQAIGTQFAAVSCPQLPDTRGWFAGLRQFNINFVFYAYAEPIDAMNTAEGDLQAILDTVQFVMPEITPEPAAEITPLPGN